MVSRVPYVRAHALLQCNECSSIPLYVSTSTHGTLCQCRCREITERVPPASKVLDAFTSPLLPTLFFAHYSPFNAYYSHGASPRDRGPRASCCWACMILLARASVALEIFVLLLAANVAAGADSARSCHCAIPRPADGGHGLSPSQPCIVRCMAAECIGDLPAQ
jgi:hypothetical protein